MKRTLLTFTISLLSTLTFCQHSDQKEYGYHGKVKKVVSYYYDTTYGDVKKGVIINKLNWICKTILDYDSSGNTTKYEFTYKPSYSLDSSIKMITTYEKVNGQTVAYERDQNSKLVSTQTSTWLSKYSYRITVINTDGNKDFEMITNLNKNFRDESGTMTLFDKNGEITSAESHINVIDKNNRFTKSIKTIVQTKSNSITYYRYFQFDKKQNANVVHLSFTPTGNPYKIVLRHFEYY